MRISNKFAMRAKQSNLHGVFARIENLHARSPLHACVRCVFARCVSILFPLTGIFGRVRAALSKAGIFFYCTGVIGMQCTSIRGGTVPTSPLTVARRAANG